MFLEKKKFLDLIGPRFNRAGVRALSFDIEIFSKFFENFQSVIGPLYRGSTPLKQHFIF